MKSYLKQTHHKIKYPIKTSKLMRYKIVHQMLEDIQMLRKMGLNYLKEGLNALHVILRQYKKINSDLPLNLQHLIKSTELLQQLTLTLCNKKLRSRREKENKLVGALKNVLTEKMTESLQCFTSRNVAL